MVDDSKPYEEALNEAGFSGNPCLIGMSSEVEGDSTFRLQCREVDVDGWKHVDDGENDYQQTNSDSDDAEKSVPDIRQSCTLGMLTQCNPFSVE